MKFESVPTPNRIQEGWGLVESCGGTGTELGHFKTFYGSEFDCQEKCRKCNDCKFFELNERWDRNPNECYLYRTLKDIEEIKGEPYVREPGVGKHRVVGPKVCGKMIFKYPIFDYICCTCIYHFQFG